MKTEESIQRANFEAHFVCFFSPYEVCQTNFLLSHYVQVIIYYLLSIDKTFLWQWLYQRKDILIWSNVLPTRSIITKKLTVKYTTIIY